MSAAKSAPPQRTCSSLAARPEARMAWKMSRCVLVIGSPASMIRSPRRICSTASFTAARFSSCRRRVSASSYARLGRVARRTACATAWRSCGESCGSLSCAARSMSARTWARSRTRSISSRPICRSGVP